ncbi:MAG TPA: hypothetical protein VNJ47_00060 [Nevskiales bacterium]|nr:hypothetical protein [Nevskiales bacterium]
MNTRIWRVSTLGLALLLAACDSSESARDAGGRDDGGSLPGERVAVNPAESTAAQVVSPAFLSFAVDIIAVVGGEAADPDSDQNIVFPPYDFDRPKLRRLVQALLDGKPAYMRISGTQIDQTYFDMSDTPVAQPPPNYKRVLTRAQWDKANAFARALGLEIFIGINAGPGPRDALYNWVPDNARDFLRYTAEQQYPVTAIEFGNEPNVFYGAHAGQILPTYTALSYARDIRAFEALRQELLPGATFVGPGPFLTSRDPRGEQPISVRGVTVSLGAPDPGPALDAVGAPLGPESWQVMPLVQNIYGAVNYHYYPVFSGRCVFNPKLPEDPLQPAFLDSHLENHAYMSGLRDQWNAGAPLWLGETGSAACGGAVDYSDRHIATFYYLNHLGQLAQRGVQVYVRQALEGGTYGLLQQNSLEPNPDYWASLLWRRLMGRQQLTLDVPQAPQTLRVYAACTPGRPGAVTLLALNLSRDTPVNLELQGPGAGAAQVYTVTAPSLDARQIALNGRTLTAPEGVVPRLDPVIASSGVVTLPAAAYAFVVQDAAAQVCLGG